MNRLLIFTLLFCSCNTQYETPKNIYHALLDKNYRYTIETDFLNYNSTFNIYNIYNNEKLFEKEFNLVPYVDSVSNDTIYLSKYYSTGSTDYLRKKNLYKSETGELKFKTFKYRIFYFTDNYGGVSDIVSWKFERKVDLGFKFRECFSDSIIIIPYNDIVNFGGELRIKKNIDQGLSFIRIKDCDSLKGAGTDFIDLLLEK